MYVISSILAVSTCFLLSFFIILKGKRNKQNKLFSVATILTGIWCAFPFLSYLAQDDSVALSYVRIIYFFAVFVPATWLNFHLTILGQAKAKSRLIALIYFLSLPWVALVFHPQFIKGVVRTASFTYLTPGSLYLFFFLFFAAVMLVVLFNLFKGHRESQGHKKNQVKYILLASIISIIGGLIHFVSAYLKIEPIPHDVFIIIFPCLIAYAIVKYRLMDIRVIITRTAIFAAVYALVLGLPFMLIKFGKDWLIGLLGAGWWIGPLTLMASLATAGPFAYIYLLRRAEAILLGEQLNYRDTLKQATAGIVRIRKSKELLDYIAHTVTETLAISHSAIYLFDAGINRFILKAGHKLKKHQPVSIDREDAVVAWQASHKEPLVYDEIKRRSEDEPDPVFKKLEGQMRDLNAAVILSSLLDDQLFTILLLGNKLSGRAYTSEDLTNFSVFVSEATLAVENALRYENIEEQVKQRTAQLVDVQKQLIQAEKMATVGTLAGGVAHEINNPLAVILTNVQMLLAENSHNAGLDKESLEMIEEATKRCRTIVQKLMVFAKKPMEATSVAEVDLLSVVKNIVDFLKYQLEQENITISVHAPQEQYIVVGSQNELEQVIGNIIINARDSIKQIKKNGNIDVTLAKGDDRIKVAIKDEGAGIPKEILPRIFDPFFTTKDVGKGLGLGLSICQAIIEKHKGTIAVKSEPGKGSTFTIQFPRQREV